MSPSFFCPSRDRNRTSYVAYEISKNPKISVSKNFGRVNYMREIPLPKVDTLPETSIEALLRLVEHPGWKAQCEAVRKLAFLTDCDESARTTLTSLYTSDSFYPLPLRGHAAVGLWRVGTPLNEIIEHLSALDVDIARTAVRDKKHAFLGEVSSLLDSDSDERGRAISILQWLMPERDTEHTRADPTVVHLRLGTRT